MKPRVRVKAISDKKLAQHGGRLPWSSIPTKGGKPKARNPKRKAKEFARCYHSVERVEFVKDQPCKACGRLFASENAHVLGNGGAGRKAGYKTIAPLCGPTFDREGCHRTLHRLSRDLFEKDFGIDLEAAAAATQRAWLEYSGRSDG